MGALPYAAVFKQPAAVAEIVLLAAVRVMHQPASQHIVHARHPLRIECYRCAQRVRHAPRRDAAAPRMHHAHNAQDSLGSRDVSAVVLPLFAQAIVAEVAVHEGRRRNVAALRWD